MTARSEEIEEADDYVNAPVRTVDDTGTTSDQKFPSFTKSFPPLTVCWVTLLIIMSLRIYFTAVMSENNAKLTAENQQLKTLMQHLNNQTTQCYNMTEQKERKLTILTNKQKLERQKNNLTKKLQDMEAKWNELNVSRAQWSIDAYCPKENKNRTCKPCQTGWLPFQSSCYAINDPTPAHQRTWDQARADCKGKNSDLVVIVNQEEKTFISDHSWKSSGTNGYWIGLTVEDGKWKWVDGTDLIEDLWMQQHSRIDGHCAMSVQNKRWKSVNCRDKKRWICKQKAVSV